MTEDFDKDLEDLAGDLGDLDLGGEDTGDLAGDLGDLDLGGEDTGDLEGLDLGGEGAGDEAAASDAGDSIELDDDLQSMLDDAGGETAAGGGEDDILGGGGGDDILGGDMGGGGGGEPAAPPAASRGPATAQEIMSQLAEGQTVNLEFLLDIKLHVTFEVGRSKMLISDLLTLGQGSVIELHRLVGDELDLLVNGKLIAKGEVVVINEKFGCKITDIIPPEDRIKHMGAI